jgi:hypothetical protein
VDYQRYSNQFKEAILNKLSQSDLSVRKFAESEDINLSTLYFPYPFRLVFKVYVVIFILESNANIFKFEIHIFFDELVVKLAQNLLNKSVFPEFKG